MRQKQIHVGNKKLLALDMPEGASEPRIIKNYIKDKYFHFSCKTSEEKGFTTYVGQAFFYKDFGGKTKYPSDMKIVGFKNDITEEQWAEIVEKIQLYHHIVYENYMNQSLDATFKTAKESGLSLLQANNIDYLNCLIILVI